MSPIQRSRSGYILPPRLRAGDTVAAISLSSGMAEAFPHRYATGKRQFQETFGVRVIETPHALKSDSWLARHPEARADDLHWALTNPDVRGIVAIIGGDDSVRILPHVDTDLIRKHPKVLLGFSDTTIALTTFLRAGVVPFHGPALMTDLAEHGGIHPYVERALRRTIFEPEPHEWEPAPGWTEEFRDWAQEEERDPPRALRPNPGWRWLQGSEATSGPLIGGCLDVLEFLKGTPWWPKPQLWDGAVLMFETSEEAPPPEWVGRWLRNYGHQGVLDRARALLIARPMGYSPEQAEALDRIAVEVLADFGRSAMPLVTNLDVGHTSPMWTTPLGCTVRVDPRTESIRSEEPGAA